MKRIMYLVIWGVCLRPLTRSYIADSVDGYGLNSQELDTFDFREGDGYSFTITTKVDADNTEGRHSLTAYYRASDGLVKLEACDLAHFEPSDIIERQYYTVESDSEAEALADELEPERYIDDFPRMRAYTFTPDQADF